MDQQVQESRDKLLEAVASDDNKENRASIDSKLNNIFGNIENYTDDWKIVVLNKCTAAIEQGNMRALDNVSAQSAIINMYMNPWR